MKIGISVDYLEPKRNHGHLDGIGVYTKNLLLGISSPNCQVFPYSFSRLKVGDRPVIGQPLGVTFPVAAAAALSSGGVLKLNPNVDVYHATDYKILPMRCPVVATLHDAISMKAPQLAYPDFLTIKNHIYRRLARYADVVIAVSQYSVSELIDNYGVDEGRVRVVHNGVDKNWLQPLTKERVQSVLARRGLVPGYFLFVGTLQPRKNIDRVIAAHDLLSDETRQSRPLVVVGRPGWRCEELIERLIQKQAVGEAHWLADVSNMDELRALYSGAHTFVFPSLYEGFGLPVLEAFASRIPVVTSTTTSLPEVSNGIAWEVDPTSVEDIAAAMTESLPDGVERNTRIEAGFERASMMTWDHMIEKVRNIYRDIC